MGLVQILSASSPSAYLFQYLIAALADAYPRARFIIIDLPTGFARAAFMAMQDMEMAFLGILAQGCYKSATS